MSKIMVGVPYLEGPDVNPDGSLKNYVNKGKPALLLLYASWCPHCTKIMPVFQELRPQMKNVELITIQADGSPLDKDAAKSISNVVKVPGFPALIGFNAQGKFVKMHSGNRDAQSLAAFAQTL